MLADPDRRSINSDVADARAVAKPPQLDREDRTFASILGVCRVDARRADALLGHTDPRMTLGVYAQLLKLGHGNVAALEQARGCTRDQARELRIRAVGEQRSEPAHPLVVRSERLAACPRRSQPDEGSSALRSACSVRKHRGFPDVGSRVPRVQMRRPPTAGDNQRPTRVSRDRAAGPLCASSSVRDHERARDRAPAWIGWLDMVEARSMAAPYQTRFHAGEHSGRADTLKDGVGGTAGMRPHELLEAALASCLTITARMALDEPGVNGSEVTVRVELERTNSTSLFRYSVELDSGLDDDQRDAVLRRVERSPVRQTLSKEVRFRAGVRDAGRQRDSHSK